MQPNATDATNVSDASDASDVPSCISGVIDTIGGASEFDSLWCWLNIVEGDMILYRSY